MTQIKPYQSTLKKGEPLFAIALTLVESQIQEIDIVANPEKLRHIPPLPFEELCPRVAQRADPGEKSGSK